MSLIHIVFAGLYALLGFGLCVRLRLPCRGLEGFAWAYGLGTGIASLGVMAMLALGLWQPLGETPALAGLLLVLAIALAGGKTRLPPPAPADFRGARVPLGVPVAMALGFAALVFSSLWNPGPDFDTGFDAQAYHLPAVARLARDGLGANVGLLSGELRLGFDLLFLPGFQLSDPTSHGAATIHFVATLALAAAVAGEVARRTSRAVGIGFGVLFIVTPGIASIANHAYVDVGVGLYVFLALAAASRALREGDRASVLAAGLFAGFAANAKLPAGAAIAAVALALLVGHKGTRGAKKAAGAAAVALVVTLPWFVRAYLNTGNPFFPALLGTFGSGWADAAVVAATKQDVLAQLPIPKDAFYGVRAVVHGAFSASGGFEAPAWVVALAPAAWLRPKTPSHRGLLAGAAVLLVAWVAFVPLFRFGIGLWAWGAVAAGVGAVRLARVARPVALLTFVVLVGLLGLGVVRALSTDERGRRALHAGQVFGAAVAFLDHPSRTLRGPLGLSSSFVAFGPPGTIALDPSRNGMLHAEDFDDPARLLAACRRIGLRSLVLDETTDEGRKAIACAHVWAKDPAFRVVFADDDVRLGGVVTVAFPREVSK